MRAVHNLALAKRAARTASAASCAAPRRSTRSSRASTPPCPRACAALLVRARGCSRSRAWLHVAQGGSLRDAGLPVVVTYAIAHRLRESTHAGPRLAMRAAQLDAAKVPAHLRLRLACSLAQHPFGDAAAEALLARFI